MLRVKADSDGGGNRIASMVFYTLASPQTAVQLQSPEVDIPMTALGLPLVVEAAELHSRLSNSHLGEPHREDSRLLIVDLSNEQNYRSGHVPGAGWVSPRELVAGTPPAPGKLPAKQRLDQLFSRLGLQPDHHVIAYDDEGGGWAGRFLWTLDVIGHSSYSYLNGGLWAWRAGNIPLQQEAVTPASNNVSVVIHNEAIAELDEILRNLQQPEFVIWDARGAEEYSGEKHTALKAGHIPGAIHCDWLELMDPQRDMRIRADVKELLAKKGLTGERPIVTHCQSHHRSGLTYLVGKMLGFNIRAYPGSWSEWGNHPTTPVER